MSGYGNFTAVSSGDVSDNDNFRVGLTFAVISIAFVVLFCMVLSGRRELTDEDSTTTSTLKRQPTKGPASDLQTPLLAAFQEQEQSERKNPVNDAGTSESPA